MLAMMKEITRESWIALRRSRTRSLLTMLGIVWGIVAVTLAHRLRQWLSQRTGISIQRVRQKHGDCVAGADQRATGRSAGGQGGQVRARRS